MVVVLCFVLPSDLYQLGMTLYEAVVGRPAFSYSDPLDYIHAHLAEELRFDEDVVSGIGSAGSAGLHSAAGPPAAPAANGGGPHEQQMPAEAQGSRALPSPLAVDVASSSSAAAASAVHARASASSTAWSVFLSVVLKLVAKNVDERYHSASGAYADLHYCLRVAEGVLAPDAAFVIGRADADGHFAVSRRLYGRDRQVTQLQDAFQRCLREPQAGGRPQCVLVAGFSGIGTGHQAHPCLACGIDAS